MAFLYEKCLFRALNMFGYDLGHFWILSKIGPKIAILGHFGGLESSFWRGLDFGHWSGETWLAGVGAYYGQLRVEEGGGEKVRSSMN